MKSDILFDTKCPHCKSTDLHRVEVRTWGTQTVVDMQCHKCSKKFPILYAKDAK